MKTEEDEPLPQGGDGKGGVESAIAIHIKRMLKPPLIRGCISKRSFGCNEGQFYEYLDGYFPLLNLRLDTIDER